LEIRFERFAPDFAPLRYAAPVKGLELAGT